MERSRTAVTAGALALALALAAASCAGPIRPAARRALTTPTASPTTTSTLPPSGKPVDPARLGVVLDPQGRPYDVEVDDLDPRPTHRRVATLETTDGIVRTVDASWVMIRSMEHGDPRVRFPGAHRLDVTAISQHVSAGDSVVAIRLDVPRTTVARWRRFQGAFSTDGATGAVISEAAARTLLDRGRFVDEAAAGRDADALGRSPVVVHDLDGRPGADTVLFGVYMDGEFPMSQGVDRKGRTVSLVVWGMVYPWRLAITDGTPPRDVTEREDELQECMDGRRGLVPTPLTADPERVWCPHDE